MRKFIVLAIMVVMLSSLTACNVRVAAAAPPDDTPAESLLEQSGISAYDFQTAVEFLRDFTSIFTGVNLMETSWDDENRVEAPTGRFMVWDSETGFFVPTYERPEISLLRSRDEPRFYDRYGNIIAAAPWLYTRRGEGWSSLYYADHFNLFDLDNDGIPEIFIHFHQTFEGGYAGFYRIFRYIDGEYRMLGTKAFENGEELPWYRSWFGITHELFLDADGRIIVFLDSLYHDWFRYEQLVLTDEYAELHLLVDMGSDDWEAWREHHWQEWEFTQQLGRHRVDGWMYHNPAIFGTDIPLTPLRPFAELADEIHAYVAIPPEATAVYNHQTGYLNVAGHGLRPNETYIFRLWIAETTPLPIEFSSDVNGGFSLRHNLSEFSFQAGGLFDWFINRGDLWYEDRGVVLSGTLEIEPTGGSHE